MKCLLIYLIITLAAITDVFAEENDWIDGITFKITQTANSVNIYYKDKDAKGRYGVVGSSGGSETPKHFDEISYAFPVAIELKENLMNSWSYRQAFLDWTYESELNDLYPNSNYDDSEILNAESETSYLRQSENLRNMLENSFFNSEDKGFTSTNPNWALSADLVYSALMIGYSWGIFYPTYNDTHRWMKVGVGFGAFIAKMEIDYNLCSRYELSTTYDDEGNAESKRSGKCIGKHKIDRLETQGVGTAAIVNVTIWERKTQDSIWRIGTGESGLTSLNLSREEEKKAFGLEKHENYFAPEITLTTLTLVSYTSRF